jgi:hypothetical protein
LGLGVFSGLRGDVGQDTLSYTRMYQEYQGLPVFYWFSRMEPVFVSVMYFHKIVFNNLTLFFLLFSFLQSFLLSYATSGMVHRALFLAFYVIFYFLEYHTNILRAGLGLLLFLCALSADGKKSWFIFVLSIFSHISLIVFLPVLLVREKIRLSVIFLVVIGLLLGFLFFKDLIFFKLIAYSLDSFSRFKVSLVAVGFTVLTALVVLVGNVRNKQILTAFLIFIIILNIATTSEIFYRFVSLSVVTLFYLLLSKRTFSLLHMRIKSHAILVIALAFWFGLGNIKFYITEREQRIESGTGNPMYSYLPYKFFWEDDRHVVVN